MAEETSGDAEDGTAGVKADGEEGGEEDEAGTGSEAGADEEASVAAAGGAGTVARDEEVEEGVTGDEAASVSGLTACAVNEEPNVNAGFDDAAEVVAVGAAVVAGEESDGAPVGNTATAGQPNSVVVCFGALVCDDEGGAHEAVAGMDVPPNVPEAVLGCVGTAVDAEDEPNRATGFVDDPTAGDVVDAEPNMDDAGFGAFPEVPNANANPGLDAVDGAAAPGSEATAGDEPNSDAVVDLVPLDVKVPKPMAGFADDAKPGSVAPNTDVVADVELVLDGTDVAKLGAAAAPNDVVGFATAPTAEEPPNVNGVVAVVGVDAAVDEEEVVDKAVVGAPKVKEDAPLEAAAGGAEEPNANGVGFDDDNAEPKGAAGFEEVEVAETGAVVVAVAFPNIPPLGSDAPNFNAAEEVDAAVAAVEAVEVGVKEPNALEDRKERVLATQRKTKMNTKRTADTTVQLL